MNCHPSCEVSLPRIGKTYINSKLDTCKSPAVLTLSINSDGRRSISTFVAGNQLEYRTIGNEYWPLQLQVKFRNTIEGDYHADACLHTVRTGNTTCFMNGFLENSLDTSCGHMRHGGQNASFPVVILCVILATCLLMIAVAVAAMFHRIYSSQKGSDSRRNSYTGKTCSTGFPSLLDDGYVCKFPHELTVIDEVDEKDNDADDDEDCEEYDDDDGVSTASSGFESAPNKSMSEDDLAAHQGHGQHGNRSAPLPNGSRSPQRLATDRTIIQVPTMIVASQQMLPTMESFKPKPL